jgi:folylpolyglutamate synthase
LLFKIRSRVLKLTNPADFVNHMYDPAAIAALTMQKTLAERWQSLDPKATVLVKASIEEALDYVKQISESREGSEKEVQALITGSLHLVGGALGVLEGASTL